MVAWNSRGELQVHGKAIEFRCVGPNPTLAPTIVLLHEGLGCVELWRDFPEKLSDKTGFGVCAYSRAGYGKSDPAELPRPVDYQTIEAVNVLPRVLTQIGFRRGILAGHSDGATIAAIYAGSVIDHRVRGIVLMAPHFFTEEVGLQEIAKSRIQYETGGLREKMAKYHKDPDNAFYGWNEAWLNPEFLNWDVTEVIDYLRVPILAIQGRDDQYGTPAQIEALQTKSYAPVDARILNDCHHAPYLEQPDQVLSAIGDFTDRLERIEAVQAKLT